MSRLVAVGSQSATMGFPRRRRAAVTNTETMTQPGNVSLTGTAYASGTAAAQPSVANRPTSTWRDTPGELKNVPRRGRSLLKE